MDGSRVVTSAGSNTTIGAVATNVPFSKAEMNKIAQMAHDGFTRSITPVHTMSDGDTIFALSAGRALSVRADVSAVATIAATVMAHGVARAVVQDETLTEHQLPVYRDYVRSELGLSA
jgi:L-aminopeptidase/D-esterase-like protein